MGTTNFDTVAAADGMAIGGGTTVKKITFGTVNINPASIGASQTAETAVTIAGLASGDFIVFNIPASLESTLAYAGCRVSGTTTAQVALANLTAGSVNGADLTWSYAWFDLT
jgi:hypothetical protein